MDCEKPQQLEKPQQPENPQDVLPHLPGEIWRIILRKTVFSFETNEKVLSMRLVCRQFNVYVSDFLREKLLVATTHPENLYNIDFSPKKTYDARTPDFFRYHENGNLRPYSFRGMFSDGVYGDHLLNMNDDMLEQSLSFCKFLILPFASVNPFWREQIRDQPVPKTCKRLANQIELLFAESLFPYVNFLKLLADDLAQPQAQPQLQTFHLNGYRFRQTYGSTMGSHLSLARVEDIENIGKNRFLLFSNIRYLRIMVSNVAAGAFDALLNCCRAECLKRLEIDIETFAAFLSQFPSADCLEAFQEQKRQKQNQEMDVDVFISARSCDALILQEDQALNTWLRSASRLVSKLTIVRKTGICPYNVDCSGLSPSAHLTLWTKEWCTAAIFPAQIRHCTLYADASFLDSNITVLERCLHLAAEQRHSSPPTIGVLELCAPKIPTGAKTAFSKTTLKIGHICQSEGGKLLDKMVFG